MHVVTLLPLLLAAAPAQDAFQRLHADRAEASSHLKSNWNKYEENYHPNYALDDDPKTAWVEGADGEGIGESLTIPVSALKSARAVRLVVFNGYQKSKALLEANAAPSALAVVIRGPGGRESGRRELALRRVTGPQSFDIPIRGGVAEVTLTIAGVHQGRKYQDTCISDVQILVQGDIPYNASVENGKHKALLAWKKERLDLAKYYARLPPTYPYATSRFELDEKQELLQKRYAELFDDDKDGYPERGRPAPDFKPLHALLAAGTIPGAFTDDEKALIRELTALRARPPATGARWYSLATRGKVAPPENFPLPVELDPLLHLQDATLFEANGPGTRKPVLKDHIGYQEGTALSNVLLLEGTPQDVKKAYVTFTRVTVERSSASSTTHVLVTYHAGAPTRMAVWSSSDGDMWQATRVGVWRIDAAGGKVSALREHALEHAGTPFEEPNEFEGIAEITASFTAPPTS